MLGSLFLIAIFLCCTAIALTLSIPERTCGVAEPTDEIRGLHAHLRHAEHTDPTLFNATTFREAFGPFSDTNRATLSLRKRQEYTYTIPIWFHIVSSTAASDPSNPKYVTQSMIDDQYAYLVIHYHNSSIEFPLQDTTRTTNDIWAVGADDLGMKTALRQGSYNTLNVFFQSDLQTSASSSSSSQTRDAPTSILLGFCTLPVVGVTASTPQSDYITDGCNILSGTMPGGWLSGYNLGGTLVHEIGHWNGLLHPFQDTTCDQEDYGDYIADTPQMSMPTNGCPEGKNSCPASGYDPNEPDVVHTPSGFEGPDPIHNFMDYSSDACYTGFTSGQAARMWNVWGLMRSGR
ncbi:MAG: hypothetical protein Q9160_006014 [Pyrenula sp. 1 TL-2023]